MPSTSPGWGRGFARGRGTRLAWVKMDGENGNPLEGRQGIGRALEEAREEVGLSLRDVEEGTRIRSRYLRALEREEFDVLPAVYVLGSLKTYGDFLGLDGAALSRQLKASLLEPEEPEAQPAVAGGRRDEDDEYGAGPVWAVGFDQLFVGAGIILISVLAIMTLVAAIAQQEEPLVSQLDEPSTPEPPSEMALAGNVEGTIPQDRRADGTPNATSSEKDDESDEPKEPDSGGEDGDQSEKEDRPSIFGDVEFVPMSPSPEPSPATASASASAPASAPASTPASTMPSSASPEPPDPPAERPGRASASAEPSATGSPPPDVVSSPASAPSRQPAAAPAGSGAQRLAPAQERGQVSAAVDRQIGETFGKVGLD